MPYRTQILQIIIDKSKSFCQQIAQIQQIKSKSSLPADYADLADY